MPLVATDNSNLGSGIVLFVSIDYLEVFNKLVKGVRVWDKVSVKDGDELYIRSHMRESILKGGSFETSSIFALDLT